MANKCEGKIKFITTRDGEYRGHVWEECKSLDEDCRCVVKRTPDRPATSYFERCMCEGAGEDKSCVLTLQDTPLKGDDGPFISTKLVCMYPYDCDEGLSCGEPKALESEEFGNGGETLVKTTYVCGCE